MITQIIAFCITIIIIYIVAKLLLNKVYPQAILLISGLVMMLIALAMGLELPAAENSTGFVGFDFFQLIKETFVSKFRSIGIMIMAIGGFVAYMRKIKASDVLVYLAIKPLSLFKKYPYLAASLVIPIGQFLFMCTPSAAGLGLLLMASIYPVLVRLGVTPLTATSVITACTVFDMGPASANTAQAANVIGLDNISYFLNHQLPLTLPLTAILMVAYFFVNRHFDRKQQVQFNKQEQEPELKLEAPRIYAILPVLPLILLTIFSNFFNSPIVLKTPTAMLVSFFVALLFEMIHKRNFKAVMDSIKIFFEGMGKVFVNVVSLIICADIFAKGLMSLGFIRSLVGGSQILGMEFTGIAIVMTLLIFGASMLMGSGNASFFGFSPLVPGISSSLNGNMADMILPMQLSSSMGRACSPIAGVIVACADIANISSVDLAKRNLIPLSTAIVVMIAYHFFIQ